MYGGVVRFTHGQEMGLLGIFEDTNCVPWPVVTGAAWMDCTVQGNVGGVTSRIL